MYTGQLNRKYRIEFFDIKDNTLVPYPGYIDDTFQMQFDYTVGLHCFNTATFNIYNINSDTRSLFTGNNSKRGFRLYTWWYPNAKDNYVPNKELIFQGLTYNTITNRDYTELITTVIACDAVFNLNYPKPSKTFPSGTSGTAIINFLTSYYNGTMVFVGAEYLTKVYKAPFSITNKSVQDILSDLCSDNACTFASYSDGTYIFPNIYNNSSEITISGGNVKEINRFNGMVYSPRVEGVSPQLMPIDYFSQKEVNKNNPFVTVHTKLRKFFPGEFVKLGDVGVLELNNKVYQVYSVKYTGDHRGQNWMTSLKLYPRAR